MRSSARITELWCLPATDTFGHCWLYVSGKVTLCQGERIALLTDQGQKWREAKTLKMMWFF